MNTVQPIRDIKAIDHMRKTLNEMHPKYGIMFTVGINCGLRVSDVLTLKVSDVKGKEHIVITEKKTNKTKRFPINKTLSKAISTYIKQSGLTDDDYLIPSRKGENKPISRIQAYRVLNKGAEVCGLSEIGTHTMRKTFGYHFYQRTHDVAMLMDIFNHSAPSITLRYIGINDDMKDESLKYFYL